MSEAEAQLLPYYPVSAAAKEAGVNRRMLYYWIAAGKVKAYTLPGAMRGGRQKLVLLADVLNYKQSIEA